MTNLFFIRQTVLRRLMFSGTRYALGLVLSSLAVLLLTMGTVAGQSNTPAPFKLSQQTLESIVAAVNSQFEKQQLVGVAFGLIENGHVAHTQGLGFADREKSIVMTPQHLIRWASVSKTITASVAGQLVEAGKLGWDDDVRQWVPEFPDHGHKITVRDLLCHQSGIVHYSNGKVVRSRKTYEQANPFQNVIVALDRFKESPLVHPPGEKYSYSTHAYILLSAVVERAGQEAFADQVARKIARPLQLKTLRPDYQWEEISDRAIGYRKLSNQIRTSSNTDVSWKLGGGGFISSLEDMAAFAAGLLDERILSRDLKTKMWTRQETSAGEKTAVGLGFFVEGQGSELKIWHNGSQEKSKTHLLIFPNQNRGIVVMSNCEYAEPGRMVTAIDNAWRHANPLPESGGVIRKDYTIQAMGN